jgi:ubiquitin thioesterase OTU1
VRPAWFLPQIPSALIILDKCVFLALVKLGYPPRSLTIVPELPLASLGLSKGEQIIVSQKAEIGSEKGLTAGPGQLPAAPLQADPSSSPSRSRQVMKAPGSNPDAIEVDGGVLIHQGRVFAVHQKPF